MFYPSTMNSKQVATGTSDAPKMPPVDPKYIAGLEPPRSPLQFSPTLHPSLMRSRTYRPNSLPNAIAPLKHSWRSALISMQP